jgi:hypothetical protein
MAPLWLFAPLFSTFFHSTGISGGRQSAFFCPDNDLGAFFDMNYSHKESININDL